MSLKETTAFRFDPALLAAMRALKAREGIPVTTQMEMAVRDWLKRKGVPIKSDRSAIKKGRA